MLKETETEETVPVGFFCHISIINDISVGGGPAPPGYAYIWCVRPLMIYVRYDY